MHVPSLVPRSPVSFISCKDKDKKLSHWRILKVVNTKKKKKHQMTLMITLRKRDEGDVGASASR